MISGEGTSLITTLNISSVQPSDVGLYECGASIDKNITQMEDITHLCAKGLIHESFSIILYFLPIYQFPIVLLLMIIFILI